MWSKLWNLVEIVKSGQNCEILFEIVKFGQNYEFWSKLGNLVEDIVTLVTHKATCWDYLLYVDGLDWMDGIGSLKHWTARAPLCGANKWIIPIFLSDPSMNIVKTSKNSLDNAFRWDSILSLSNFQFLRKKWFFCVKTVKKYQMYVRSGEKQLEPGPSLRNFC